MFPYEQEDELIEEELPEEFEIDFKTGQLTGAKVTGSKAVAMWAYLALKTERYNYFPYSWDYGQEFKDLIGYNHSKEYINTEAARMIKECLTVNEHIQDVVEISARIDEDNLKISCKIVTGFGEEELNV